MTDPITTFDVDPHYALGFVFSWTLDPALTGTGPWTFQIQRGSTPDGPWTGRC